MTLAEPLAEPAAPQAAAQRKMTLVCFSGDMDKLMAALSIATTAAASGAKVTIFFTFWGLSAVRTHKRFSGKGLVERMLNTMLPARSNRTGMSRMNMLGMGPRFFRFVMRKKNVADIDALVDAARLVGVELVACTMSMDVMGIGPDELVDGVSQAGATSCVQNLFSSGATLFV